MSVAMALVLHTGFLFALLVVVLSLYCGGKILRRVMPSVANAGESSRDARVKAAQAKKLADNQAAMQPARVDFASALENQKRGIALIRPYPPRNLPSSRSRIGGLPDLPRSIAWPRVSQDNDRRVKKGGYPLHFIAQRDLSELPQIDSPLPTSGTLFFFAHLDEELGWSGSKNSVRVLFDPQSEGHRVPPPDSITPVFDGGSDYQGDFGIDGDIHHTILNEWPLITAPVETIPGPAFSPSDSLYSALLHQRSILETEYLISQLNGKVPCQFSASVVHTSDLGWTTGKIYEDGTKPTKLAFEEVLCHLRICELLVRRLINMLKSDEQNSSHLTNDGMELLDRILHSSQESASLHVLLETWIANIVRAQVKRADFSHALREALLQFVAECVGTGIDTRQIHDKIFEFAAAAHVIKRSAWGMYSSDDDESIAFFHQCLGNVWTAQGRPVESDQDFCLLHLKSDYGLRLPICDVGSMQFWITPADLAARNFENVWGTTQGY